MGCFLKLLVSTCSIAEKFLSKLSCVCVSGKQFFTVQSWTNERLSWSNKFLEVSCFFTALTVQLMIFLVNWRFPHSKYMYIDMYKIKLHVYIHIYKRITWTTYFYFYLVVVASSLSTQKKKKKHVNQIQWIKIFFKWSLVWWGNHWQEWWLQVLKSFVMEFSQLIL